LYEIAGWCKKYNIKFKLNTVVNKLNYMEDMNEHLGALQPFRWKCFQVLIVRGENDSSTDTLRNGHRFTITDEEFESFCERHNTQRSLVPEPNRLMAKSYLILDEYMRFLDRTGKQPSRSILEVDVSEALKSVFWDKVAFLERGGIYDWGKDDKGCGSEGREELAW
jgi:radical S-adenosyl methionine domain-containing protein 2